MRLSATERIIREAEEQDARAASSRNRDSGRVAEASSATETARELSRSHDWSQSQSQSQSQSPSFDIDVDDLDISDEDDKTLVNAEKAAAALQELRSYEAPLRRQPFNVVAPRLTNAPADSGIVASRPAPVPPNAVFPVPPFPKAVESMGMHHDPGRLFAVPAPTDTVRPRHAVGRGVGLLIAAATTIVVALGVGAWTTDMKPLRIGDIGRGSPDGNGTSAIRPIHTPRAPVSPVIVPTIPNTPPEPEGPLASPPGSASAPPQIPTPVNPSSTGHRSAADLGAPASGSMSVGATHRQTLVSHRPRPSRKPIVHKSRRRGSHTAKVAASRSRIHGAVEVASPPTSRISGTIRGTTDPDSTLPITE